MSRIVAAMVVLLVSGCPSPMPLCDAGECDDAGAVAVIAVNVYQ